ncbi:GtrA family protein [Pseudonocardia sp. N23]|uniref:GtrA family protein n=1 Tax=Pseudonocardia sp. N23 TaxID=1987376 RepID=UPI000BFE1A34|nr:GtrA family protein [Pseudonocardia sp. N23]GAY08225.1 glycosyl transferase, family 2:GtrA-like protein [Pseudonocardia sp. N23]
MANGVIEQGGRGPRLHLPTPLPALTRRIEWLRLQHPTFVQLARFAVVGGAGTGLNALIYLAMRTWMSPVPANVVALLLSTALTTELNRRFTFDGADAHRLRASVQDVVTVVFYAFYSSVVLLLLGWLAPGAGEWEEALTVAAASVLGGLLRFVVMRYWVFAPVCSDGSAHA